MTPPSDPKNPPKATYDAGNPSVFQNPADHVEAADARKMGVAIMDPEHLPRQELSSIEQLQDLLLVRLRNQGKTPEGDWFIPRNKERVERLPPTPLTPEKLMVYLEQLEVCGLEQESCRRACLSTRQVALFKKECVEFKELAVEAKQRFVEKVEGEAARRAVEGWVEPVYGGMGRDKVVGHIRKYDSRLMELMLKRHVPEYREKFEGTLNVTGGVLVVPAQSLTAEQWTEQHGGVKQVENHSDKQKALPETVPTTAVEKPVQSVGEPLEPRAKQPKGTSRG